MAIIKNRTRRYTPLHIQDEGHLENNSPQLKYMPASDPQHENNFNNSSLSLAPCIIPPTSTTTTTTIISSLSFLHNQPTYRLLQHPNHSQCQSFQPQPTVTAPSSSSYPMASLFIHIPLHLLRNFHHRPGTIDTFSAPPKTSHQNDMIPLPTATHPPINKTQEFHKQTRDTRWINRERATSFH
ncbi:hypothetical protein EYC84_009194 [Monilinia fructicola]|uniref:Uncharacterized protein n=1 Tax=Monilinia fructicola TaxID=38448 RepID=A0A5M9JG13_MONFR|nr:hypothetical protein EYC84_009194 [Monilinia fructicola]